MTAGGIGKNDIELTCLKCGHKFKPGENETNKKEEIKSVSTTTIVITAIIVCSITLMLYLIVRSCN